MSWFDISRPQDGAYGRIGQRSQVDQQCREARQTTGSPPTLIKGHHPFPDSHDEARLHRRIRDCRRPPRRQDRRQPDRTTQQVWRHLAQVRRWNPRHRKVDQQSSSISSVRVNRKDQILFNSEPSSVVGSIPFTILRPYLC